MKKAIFGTHLPKTAARLAVCTILILVPLFNAQAQVGKKVTYGKTTFTLYQPVPGLAPIPACGFAPNEPGNTLKNPLLGPGTNNLSAPGITLKTNYTCLFSEIRDWLLQPEDVVKELAAKKGLKEADKKALDKKFKGTGIIIGDLTYQLTPTSYICFHVVNIYDLKANPSVKKFVTAVRFIELVDQKTAVVLDRILRYWNDGANLGADVIVVHQKNSKTRETAPSAPNPNHFYIQDVLNPKKWDSYEKVVDANLKKSDFAVSGTFSLYPTPNAVYTAAYEFFAKKVGKELYFSYTASGGFINQPPGAPGYTNYTPQQFYNMHNQTMSVLKKTEKEYEAVLEKHYIELFR